jgi:signal transduction histidine kinase
MYVSQLLAGERLTYTMEKRYVRRDGSVLWAKITVSLVREASGTPLYFISVVEDISERKRLEGLRDDFLAIASHELKAPLTHIKATLQLAQRRLMRLGQHAETNHEESEQIRSTREMLSQAERQVEKQNRLMNDLLDVSRLQTGKLELQMEVCDLTQLVRDVVEDQRALASDCRIEVRPSACDLLILADAQRVGQVISNYLANALKYSEASRPAEVRMAVDGRMARVEVIDEGPGLTAEQQKCIWERFYRVPGVQVTSSSSERGFGLGLYICKQLIEQQEGQVGVESTLGKGSTFWFTLPLVQEGKEPVTR